MTGSIKLAHKTPVFKWDNHRYHHLSSTLTWRAINPVKTDNDRRIRKQPLGSHADWLDLEIGYRLSFLNDRWLQSLQLILGIGHFGDKGINNLQNFIHRLTSNQEINFGSQKSYWSLIYGLYIASSHLPLENLLILPLPVLQYGLGYRADAISEEIYADIHMTISPTTDLNIGLGGKYSLMMGSSFYGNQLRRSRYEWGVGFCFYDYYQIFIKFMQFYIKGDKINQIYGDIVNIRIPL